ncbi:hypothetical protein MBRA1_003513 [Malassezia brasiliensis]|uniref:Brl1/Brr6 domain-containing protein n=1 Tax=Malassezia brasiliensis TaxID=1821822 RepID=A0AAF0E0F7_9BASI|nr:hypothetical protein MBRA1_003513 [Malassezia brasiliensis]
MAYVRGTQAPMDLEPSTERPSVFDAPPPEAAADVSLMDVEEAAPEPAFTPLVVGAPSAAVPGLRSRKEGTTAREAAPMPPPAPPSPRAPSPRAPSPRPPSPDVEEETSVVLRAAPRAPRRSARTFSERARDYLYARSSRSGAPAAEPRPGLLDRPEVFLTYAQVVFNASILLVFLYLLFCMVYTVQRDVSQKVHEYEIEYLGEIAACSSAYDTNRCGTDLQAPALAEACATWQRCASRDPTVVGRARVTAETFAEILNGFVDAVSWKTMLFSLVTLSIVVGATNSTLSFFRGSVHARSAPAPNYTAPYYAPYALPPDWDGESAPPRLRARRADDE